MKLKNVFSLLAALVVLCVGAMAVAAPAPSQLGQSRAAIEVAKAEIPANCNLIGYTTKGDESRITFQDPDTLEYYYVKVATATSKIKEIEVKGATFVKGSTIINKTPADIERFVKEPDWLESFLQLSLLAAPFESNLAWGFVEWVRKQPQT